MKKHFYTLTALFMSVVLWFIDSIIHFFIFNNENFEIIPDDFNELWMRSTIIILVIIFGIYVDHSARKLLQKEKQLEAARIYDSMLHASQHILNNLLNQMQLFKLEAEKCHDFDPEVIALFRQSTEEASALIRRLSEVKSLNRETIWASIDPSNYPLTHHPDSSPHT